MKDESKSSGEDGNSYDNDWSRQLHEAKTNMEEMTRLNYKVIEYLEKELSMLRKVNDEFARLGQKHKS